MRHLQSLSHKIMLLDLNRAFSYKVILLVLSLWKKEDSPLDSLNTLVEVLIYKKQNQANCSLQSV